MERRNFIKNSASTLAGVKGFSVISATVFGITFGHIAPSVKVNLAICGVGNRIGSIGTTLKYQIAIRPQHQTNYQLPIR